MRNEQWIGLIVLFAAGGLFFGMMLTWAIEAWRSKDRRERAEFNRAFNQWKKER